MAREPMAVLLVHASQLSPTGTTGTQRRPRQSALWDVALSACRRVAGIESEQARLSVVLAVTGRSDERTVRTRRGVVFVCHPHGCARGNGAQWSVCRRRAT